MRRWICLLLIALTTACAGPPLAPIVIQTDFGLKDGAVAAMHGVARTVERRLVIEALTHEIPAFDIWAAAYRLDQTMHYWPAGTVFVSVVDPGVGTERRSVVLRTTSGHYVVTPDNGTLTLVADRLGIDAVREIDETRNRRAGSERSHTFHGRDVYAYTAARLAAGQITFEQVGPALAAEVVRLPYQRPVFEDGRVQGAIPILDVQFGNVWTNIDRTTFGRLGASVGDRLRVTIEHEGQTVYQGRVLLGRTFGDVPEGQPVLYWNSTEELALALNMGNFAATHAVRSGAAWRIVVER